MSPPCVIFAPRSFDAGAVLRCLGDEEVVATLAPLPGEAPAPGGWDDVVTVFVLLPQVSPADAVEVVARLAPAPGVAIIACVPHTSVEHTRALEECGAAEVVTPASWEPARVAERLLAVLIERDSTGAAALEELRGRTRAMRRLYEHIQRMAPFNDAVLIRGETGTGKELVARALHAGSGRGELLPISVAELKHELLESELFGHERGAFSGAHAKRRGLFEAAEDGTLFLDEIGELPLPAQAKLLRVLEYHEVRPVGSNATVPIRARIVMATHRDLEQEVARGAFREDLFYRIVGNTIELPPLRERLADVPLLARHMLDEFDHEHGGRRHFFPRAMDRLMAHHWPGNVRELRNVVRNRAMFAGELGGAVRIDGFRDAPHPARARSIPFDPATEPWDEVLQRARRLYLDAVLDSAGGHRERAIARSGLSKSHFYAWLKELKPTKE
jgi:DNA-binding NtrC family response regulator